MIRTNVNPLFPLPAGLVACLVLLTGCDIPAEQPTLEAGLQFEFDETDVLLLDRRYLALDETLHDSLANLEFVLGQTTDSKQILKLDEAWETGHSLRHNLVGNVVEDGEGRYRLYYPVQFIDEESGDIIGDAVALACSPDGVRWSKPDLNIAPRLVDHPQANLIDIESHPAMPDTLHPGWTPVYFDRAAPSSKRYKAIWNSGNEAWTMTSPDGLHFTTDGRAFRHRMESNISFFFDKNLEEYVIYGRIRGENAWVDHNGEPGTDPARRGVARHRTESWDERPWPVVGETVVDPADIWGYENDLRPDIYSPNIFDYHGQYIGMPTVYFRDANRVPPDRPEMWTGTGPIYPMLAYSHDGLNFRFPNLEEAHSVVDPEPHLRVHPREDATFGEPEVGQIYASSTIIERSDRLVIHYGYRDDTHYEPFEGQFHGYFQAFMRVDGFASLRAGSSESGEWLTPELTVPEEAVGLAVNADVSGNLRAELIDAETDEPLPGFSLDESAGLSGDRIRGLMLWRTADVGEAAGREVKLRFQLEDGEIFSFAWVAGLSGV